MKYKKSIISGILAGGAGTLLGYDMGISGGTIDYVTKHFNLGSSGQGFALSVFIVGAVFGSIFTRILNDKLGRKKAQIIGAAAMLLGALGVYILGDSFTMFLILRGIAGAGMGLLFSSEPSYITEISPPKIRGALGSILQLTTGLGIIIGYSVTFFIIKGASSVQDNLYLWKTIYGTEIIVAFLFFISLFFIVQSPVWLLMKDRESEARKLMVELWPDQDIDDFIAKHKQSHSQSDETKNIENQMKKSGKYKKLMFIVFFMAALTELCGINPIIYYASNIFRKIVVEGPDSAFYQSIATGVVFTLGSFFSMIMVDKFGRRTLLFIGTFIMSASLLIIGIYIYMDIYSVFLIYLIYLFIFAYNFSAGPIRFLYIGELTPSPLRASSLGFAGVVNWVSDFLVAWTLPIMASSVLLNRWFHGSAVFFLYAAFGFLYFGLIFMLPETKGKTLHEISDYWKIDLKDS